MNEETEKERKVKKPLSKVGLILGINFAGVVAIFLFYIQFNGNPTIRVNPVTTVGDFRVYISSSKDLYLAGEPFDFKVYLTNLSSDYKNFEIYAFDLKITGSSTDVYLFKTSNVIRSTIDPKSTILIYSVKGGTNFTTGNYTGKVLMNLNGKTVLIGKNFKYTSNISPFFTFANDFIVEGQKENVSVYLRNISTDTINVKIQKIIFSISNQRQILSTNDLTLNSTLTMPPDSKSFVCNYQTKTIQNPGDYIFAAKIIGNQDMVATSVISVINKDGISGISGLKITSDLPSDVKSKVPVSFSVFLVNDDALQKKYVILDSLTVIIKKDDVEFYRFSSAVPHNFRINAGEKKIIFDSKALQELTFSEIGTYDFEVMVKIGNNSISYNKKFQSS
ncbi:hypothetical protein [Athalassotoga sp.]|uniref:hypothetical protein n=1 Tax=Athalassotoga sp. TaxID=2022597 RepID=UPI003D001148